MWAEESMVYQIYPLGMCGAPFENDGVLEHRIQKVNDWIPHIKSVGANAIYFSPVFESDTHGYNTRDYTKIDTRLGSNGDFAQVCENLHKEGIKVVLDGVFNHVGRGFWAMWMAICVSPPWATPCLTARIAVIILLPSSIPKSFLATR